MPLHLKLASVKALLSPRRHLASLDCIARWISNCLIVTPLARHVKDGRKRKRTKVMSIYLTFPSRHLRPNNLENV
ncbi:Uncharacterized protein APZ42_001923 [Daphnia magna]|uniref:Uncharacterized protein n=1 Tax=Daphnia magna TaxID=35525 RepID=A0A0P5QKG0_9CRUS|nr:Uncharacterized protein APZ42_001923 [Daphnia magna]